MAGRPWRVSARGGAVEGRALRTKCSFQPRRQCARCATVKHWSECGRLHGSGREVLSEFQTKIPHPWREDLPEFLSRLRHENISGKSLARYLHPREPFRAYPRCRYKSSTSFAVKAGDARVRQTVRRSSPRAAPRRMGKRRLPDGLLQPDARAGPPGVRGTSGQSYRVRVVPLSG